MKKKIFHNWGLKLASLLLAFVLWFVVVSIDDPPDTVTFSNVPVRLINADLLEKENKVYEILGGTDTVRVTVRAPGSILKQLRASDVVAEADMSKLTDINTIEISYTVQNANVESVKGDHDFLRLNIEDRETKWIRVISTTTGEVAEGYMVAGLSPDQTNIEVTGPKSAVDQIKSANVEVDVTNATSNMSLNAEFQLCDNEGNPLELKGVSANVSYLHMSVEVLAVREIPIELNVSGSPAEGYLATGVVECDPRTIRIAGTISAVAGVTKLSVPEEDLNIAGATGNMVFNLNLRDYLPENIRLADSGVLAKAAVTVHVEPEKEKAFTFGRTDFEILNLPPGFEIEPEETEESYRLVVSGLERAVSAIDPGTLRGTVDIAAWMAEEEIEELESRSYRIPVRFSLPESVTAENEIVVTLSFVKSEDR